MRDAGSQIGFVASCGRLISYDVSKHGFQSVSETLVVDESQKPVGTLRASDLSDGQLSLVEKSGRVLRRILPELPQGIEEKIAVEVVHQSRPGDAPEIKLKPQKIATEAGGIDIFMGSPAQANRAEPWHLGVPGVSSPEVDGRKSLFAWAKLELPNDKPLDVSSITRVQDGGEVGPQIAINDEKAPVWRDSREWKLLQGGENKLIPVAGGTLVRHSGVIARVSLQGGAPDVRDERLWADAKQVLTLPVSAVAATAETAGNAIHVVAGHAGGLARYSPATRTWQKLNLPDGDPAGATVEIHRSSRRSRRVQPPLGTARKSVATGVLKGLPDC